MKLNINGKNSTVNLALTALMAALIFVATMFFKVKIPTGPSTATMVGFANVFCVLSGFLLGPVYGGMAAGLGSMAYDLMDPMYLLSSPITFATKFLMAFVCGTIAWGGDHTAKKLSRLIVAAVSGSLAYVVLYLAYTFIKQLALGTPPEAAGIAVITSMAASLTNAVVADVVSIPLFVALRAALERARLLPNGKSTPGARPR